ncbi:MULTISPECIES: sulfate ABC transporter permease subunit CysT [Pseudochrobactrum]|uniref:Molybdenum transport system permease n=1 Tax=Pseudochrobactrum saccharolyticum TaxID=354352 RepID=A0A7W8EPZ2_9HYPH|nr:sulfate ABC transporter permease subunit CysT [Pseudochrobactrum saccharolyticum]KAB0537762.1 sulfate ABC transporter permease subunit CysT [Pseudochrobactrum saccharolyticum]MBB5091844.1 sulfate transport system permease protein [Pseudochrobactrum saccharolyticum]MDP8250311.1 sulfate ABC transporter permease subunit CysT [Pseudochrobactrum saccharolyticum]
MKRPIFKVRKTVMPGFGITMGCTLLYLTVIVALPLFALIMKTASLGFADFWAIISSPRAVATFKLTILTSAAATVFNALFGLLMAWVLVRYEFPGKRLLDAAVDLPFALPTAVAGLALVTVLSKNGWIGQYTEPLGLYLAYTPAGIIIAMAFTSIPFVIRTVQPVLEDLNHDVEEAAETLGANPWQVFSHVIWPMILPAFLAGSALSFARGLGEFGAIVFISANLPFKTEVTSLLVFVRLDEYEYPAAAALAMVMLLMAFAMLLITNLMQARQLRYAERN